MLVPLVAATTFDVVLMLHEGGQGLTGSCVYNADLFEAPTIDRMLGDFQDVLAGVVNEPEQLISTIRLVGGELGPGP